MQLKRGKKKREGERMGGFEKRHDRYSGKRGGLEGGKERKEEGKIREKGKGKKIGEKQREEVERRKRLIQRG